MPDYDEDARAIREAYSARDARSDLLDAWSPMRSDIMCLLQQREDALRRLLVRAGMTSLSGARVLEVGCGDGNILAVFQRLGAVPEHLYGVDLMANRIVAARHSHPGFRFSVSDATSLEFADGYFDVAAQFTMLSSIDSPDARRAVASEMMRVVRPGGIVISYDIRPISWILRKTRGLKHRLTRRSEVRSVNEVAPHSGEVTTQLPEVDPISFRELGTLFPDATPLRVAANVDLALCSYATPASRVVSDLLQAVPPYRSHELVGFVKDLAHA
ncbi:class I SAM-dependent methyltransferase [bacterium]|nr:class I SAM-dependent methyltransferase [bacterium]